MRKLILSTHEVEGMQAGRHEQGGGVVFYLGVDLTGEFLDSYGVVTESSLACDVLGAQQVFISICPAEMPDLFTLVDGIRKMAKEVFLIGCTKCDQEGMVVFTRTLPQSSYSPHRPILLWSDHHSSPAFFTKLAGIA